MHIILVSDRLAKARSLTVTGGHLFLAALALACVIATMATGVSYWGLRHAAETQQSWLETFVSSAQEKQTRRAEDYVRRNLSVMAVKLGEMQAQMMRLDALGERLSHVAGINPSELRFAEIPGRGGALVTSSPPRDLGVDEFSRHLDALAQRMESRTEYLGLVEGEMLEARAKARQLPTTYPVDGTWNASSFGWRLDPITGQAALHEGIDFVAEAGAPIHAAASGVVAFAGFHPGYGYLVDIDHGAGLVTRYAHCSKLLVKQGEFVKRGAKIAEVGSTGRSTGSHLHFEVRRDDKALNPGSFLRAGAQALVATGGSPQKQARTTKN
ncbi:MAG: M23 family metallopeptidase [Burkholderiales bacterium]|nr:M23 family metallopeptidase [Burkholderiales bacterium]